MTAPRLGIPNDTATVFNTPQDSLHFALQVLSPFAKQDPINLLPVVAVGVVHSCLLPPLPPPGNTLGCKAATYAYLNIREVQARLCLLPHYPSEATADSRKSPWLVLMDHPSDLW